LSLFDARNNLKRLKELNNKECLVSMLYRTKSLFFGKYFINSPPKGSFGTLERYLAQVHSKNLDLDTLEFENKENLKPSQKK